jgi:tetratricopeptide (TPR) repeat protein
MLKNTILIVKDMLRYDSLQCNGGPVPTPAIDSFYENYQSFERYYSASPGTSMYYRSFLCGKDTYRLVGDYYYDPSLLKSESRLKDIEAAGFQVIVLWPLPLKDHLLGIYFTEKTRVIVVNPESAVYLELIRKIAEEHQKYFIIAHLPHYFNSYSYLYESTIHRFDQVIELDGFMAQLLKEFSSDRIALTSDHGSLFGEKNLYFYGFHTYNEVIHVPLIINRAKGRVTYPVSSVDILDYVFYGKEVKKDYVLSDTATIGLPENRVLCLIKGELKYILEVEKGKESLYDLKYDAGENTNLLSKGYKDKHRKGKFYSLRETIMKRDDWPEIDSFYRFAKAEISWVISESQGYLSFRFPVTDPDLKALGELFEKEEYAAVAEAYHSLKEDYLFEKQAGMLCLSALIRLERYKDAYGVGLRLLKLNPYDLQVQYHMASLEQKLGRPEKAKRIFTGLLGNTKLLKKPYQIAIYFHMGELYYMLNKEKLSRKYFDRCLRLCPDHKKAIEIIARMDASQREVI